MKGGGKGKVAKPRDFQRNPFVIFGEPLAKGCFGGCGVKVMSIVVVKVRTSFAVVGVCVVVCSNIGRRVGGDRIVDGVNCFGFAGIDFVGIDQLSGCVVVSCRATGRGLVSQLCSRAIQNRASGAVVPFRVSGV